MTLRVRLAAFVAAAVGIAVVVVAFAAYRSTSQETIAGIDRFLRNRAPLAGLIDGSGPGSGPGPGPGGGQGNGRGPGGVVSDDVVAQVVFADGTVIALGSALVSLPVEQMDLDIAAGRAPEAIRTVTVDDTHYRLFTHRAGIGSAVQVARDLSETEAILNGLRDRLLLLGLAGAVLAALAGWALAGRAVRPVRELTAAAEQVSATGALDTAIPVTRSDEIGRLAAAFNEMLVRLDTSRLAQQRLVADASHELRTPLTSLRTNIELLARGTVPESDRAAMLSDLTAEVIELGALVTELVDLATVGRADEERVQVDLAALVSETISRAERRATQSFQVTSVPVMATVRPAAVTRAMSNLLDNAIKWSPADGAITVTLDREALTVGDRGLGIDPGDLPFVFERFFRSTSARSMPGSGLGLAIVAAVAEDHGWTPFARNRDGSGAEVGIRFAPT